MSKVWWIDQDQLKPKQLEVLAYANEGQGRGFILTGPPGSGKTNLLLLCLAVLKELNFKNSKAVVFTGSLRAFLGSALSIYGIEEDDVTTLNGLAREILREHGCDIGPLIGGSFQSQQSHWRTEFKGIISRGADQMFDGLFIDEAQDFDESETSIFHDCAKYTAFAIDTNQSVYVRRDDRHPVFSYENEEDLPLFALDLHYRVGYEICKFADLLMEGRGGYEGMAGKSQYDEKRRNSIVDLNKFDTQPEEFEKIISRIDSQISVYPGEQIGVTFPTNDQLSAFTTYCEDNRPDVLALITPDPEFRAKLFLGTMHDSKGLEFAVCHVAGLEKLSSFATQKTLLFTAVTRARYACYMSSSKKNPPNYLTSAYARYKGPAPVLDTRRIFRGA